MDLSDKDRMEMALKKTGVPPQDYELPPRYTPRDHGLPLHWRLHVPTSMAACPVLKRELERLCADVEAIRKANITSPTEYALELHRSIKMANDRMQRYTK